MKIVFATKMPRPQVLAALNRVEGLTLVAPGDLSGVAPHVHDADALVISDPRGADGRAIADALRAPGCRVRWVQALTAGVDGLLSHGVPDHVIVTTHGGAVAPAVAEHAMAMILAMARRIPEIVARSARYEWSSAFVPPLFALEGRTLAVIGFGSIGRQLARRARAFDLRVLGVSRSLASDPLADEMLPWTALDAALARADVVVLCVASNPQTRRLMDAARFAACKPGALFVNVTRGETVDQVALAQALRDGRLAGAFVDVTEPEPLPASDPLWQAPNLWISPHTAGAGSAETGRRIAAVVIDNLERFAAGRALAHVVTS